MIEEADEEWYKYLERDDICQEKIKNWPTNAKTVQYASRAQGVRGLLSVKDCVELERSNFFDYAANNNERLLKTAAEELQLRTKIDGKNKEERENER